MRPTRHWDLLDEGLQQVIVERLFDLCKPTWDDEGEEVVDYESVNALMQSSRSLRVLVCRLIRAAKVEVRPAAPFLLRLTNHVYMDCREI